MVPVLDNWHSVVPLLVPLTTVDDWKPRSVVDKIETVFCANRSIIILVILCYGW